MSMSWDLGPADVCGRILSTDLRASIMSMSWDLGPAEVCGRLSPQAWWTHEPP